jgi:hypothetical protein
MSCAETTTRICKNRNTTFHPEQKRKHSIPINNEAVKTQIHLKLGTHKVLHMLGCNKNLCVALADGPREIDETSIFSELIGQAARLFWGSKTKMLQRTGR